MADTTFVSKSPPTVSTSWLQDLNDLFYKGTKPLTVTTLTATTSVLTPLVSTPAGAGDLGFNWNGTLTWIIGGGTGSLLPAVDNNSNLGGAANRIKQLFTPILDSGAGSLVVKGAGTPALTVTGANLVAAGTLTVNGATATLPTVAMLTGSTVTIGTGSGIATLVGVANVNTTAVGNVGAGPDDMMTYTLPVNSLSVNGKGIRVRAWGTTANNANAKTVSFNFGGSSSSFTLSASIAGRWYGEMIVIRTGSIAQKSSRWMSEQQAGATLIAPKTALTEVTPAEAETGTIVVKCQSLGVAANDVVQEGMLVEFLN